MREAKARKAPPDAACRRKLAALVDETDFARDGAVARRVDVLDERGVHGRAVAATPGPGPQVGRRRLCGLDETPGGASRDRAPGRRASRSLHEPASRFARGSFFPSWRRDSLEMRPARRLPGPPPSKRCARRRRPPRRPSRRPDRRGSCPHGDLSPKLAPPGADGPPRAASSLQRAQEVSEVARAALGEPATLGILVVFRVQIHV